MRISKRGAILTEWAVIASGREKDFSSFWWRLMLKAVPFSREEYLAVLFISLFFRGLWYFSVYHGRRLVSG
jgi:hypothetical protein